MSCTRHIRSVNKCLASPLSVRFQVIPLTCNIPVQFEFAITILKSHPDFEVIPREGIIPADGTTNVAITSAPKLLLAIEFV